MSESVVVFRNGTHGRSIDYYSINLFFRLRLLPHSEFGLNFDSQILTTLNRNVRIKLRLIDVLKLLAYIQHDAPSFCFVGDHMILL